MQGEPMGKLWPFSYVSLGSAGSRGVSNLLLFLVLLLLLRLPSIMILEPRFFGFKTWMEDQWLSRRPACLQPHIGTTEAWSLVHWATLNLSSGKAVLSALPRSQSLRWSNETSSNMYIEPIDSVLLQIQMKKKGLLFWGKDNYTFSPKI